MTKSLCTEYILMAQVKCSHLSVPIKYFACRRARRCYLAPGLYCSIAEQKNTPVATMYRTVVLFNYCSISEEVRKEYNEVLKLSPLHSGEKECNKLDLIFKPTRMLDSETVASYIVALYCLIDFNGHYHALYILQVLHYHIRELSACC